MCTTTIPATTAEWLTAFPQLRDLSDPVWLHAADRAEMLNIAAGTMVVRKCDPCRSFLLVARGTIRVFEAAENGREILLNRIGPGQICTLTLSALIEDAPYAANAIAEEAVEIISIPASQFTQVMACSEGFRSVVLSTLAHHLNNSVRLMEQMAFRNLDLRLACLLGQLFGRGGQPHVRVTHQGLASELGTTREVISRLLKTFERMGCIKLHRGQIELSSPDALARLMQD